MTGRRQAALEALVGEIAAKGGEAVALAGDIRDEQLARRLVELAVDRFGGLDIAFNNAGITGAAAAVPSSRRRCPHAGAAARRQNASILAQPHQETRPCPCPTSPTSNRKFQGSLYDDA